MQVGWVTGPADLVSAIAKAHQFIVFTVPTSLQKAVAYGLDHESSFYT
jgi:aspartate/methionine/tyrosine aminotransferase